ncbi:MAG TPA: sulfatase-like hydrolase/transferase, partial [Anaerolineales bacterium]|nr:sulfatase-like hydrolase/transferase [Anaerolineales bacterium]
LALILLSLVARLSNNPSFTQLLVTVGVAISALIISTLILILVDNFTYTVFKYGVVSTERIPRALYGLAFLVIWAFAFYKIRRYLETRLRKKYPVLPNQWLALTMLLLTSVLLSIFSMITNQTGGSPVVAVSAGDRLPNIILLGSDGLDANHLSIYGYDRKTTPNMEKLLPKALLAKNDFPNGGTTAGSVASIMTGKLPIEARVIYPPDILNGQDSYQHLPGILKRLGYRTVDLSVSYFGDALTLNMQGGFDIANQRSGNDSPVVKITRFLAGGDSAYFVATMLQRISDRVLHIFFIKPMINPYEAVIKPARRENEQKRFDDLIAALKNSSDPVFIHVHMLGTHGPRFEIRQQSFSAGQQQNKDWMTDFYDDAILSFDGYVGELFDYLAKSDKLENTVVVVYSDHGERWSVHQRVPLLFWFPDGAHAGTIQTNVQNIDIAATILDYLQISVPAWMDGQSLLRKDMKASPYIFSAGVDSELIEISKQGLWVVDTGKRVPPFYQLGYVGLIACDQWFELYLQNPAMFYGKVKGHTYSCDSAALPTPEEAKHVLLDHLSKNGFDTSSFPSVISIRASE